MEPSPLPVLRDSSSEDLAPDGPLRPAAEGMEELDRVYSWTLWSSFSKLTRNRSPSVLLPVWGENTGGNRFHMKAIESSECVSCRPARSPTNIGQRGATSQRPGGRHTSCRVSSQPERARHTLCLISQGDGIPLSSGPSSAWRRHSLSAGLRDRQRAGLRSWSFASCQRSISMLGRDKAKPGLVLPPPGAALAGSPPGLWME